MLELEHRRHFLFVGRLLLEVVKTFIVYFLPPEELELPLGDVYWEDPLPEL